MYLSNFIWLHFPSQALLQDVRGLNPPGRVEDGYRSKLESAEHKTFILKL